MSFYFMNSTVDFSVMLSHIFAEKVIRSGTRILKLNISLVSSCISCTCNAETMMFGIVCKFCAYYAVKRHKFETYGLT